MEQSDTNSCSVKTDTEPGSAEKNAKQQNIFHII